MDQKSGQKSLRYLLRRASQLAEQQFHLHAETGGRREKGRLTARQLDVLYAISLHQPCNQQTVGFFTGIDRSTMGEMVNRLAEKGLLRQNTNPHDARAKILELTKRGQEALGSLVSADKRLERTLRDLLSTPDADKLRETLLTVAEALSKSLPKSAQTDRERRMYEKLKAKYEGVP